MTGYVFCLEPHETGVGYQFIVANKSRLEKMDLEESSIDLAVATTPRIVVNEIVYDVSRQYFRKESDGTTSRILLLYPVVQENENGDKNDDNNSSNSLKAHLQNPFLNKED